MGDAENQQPALEIPQVPKKYFGLLGNVPDIDGSFPAKSFWHLADLYGDIYQIDLLGQKNVVISSHEFIKDVVNDDNYEKVVDGALEVVRDSIGDGLFTAYSDEKNWFKAHRILVPVFGPLGVQKMFDMQVDIASQMILKWDRLGPDHRILAADDFTRLAFDTIGLCAFNHRFNDFYSEDMHIFAQQMGDTLIEAGRRAIRTNLERNVRYFSDKKYWEDIHGMHQLCDEIIEERVKNPQPEINDLLNVMLNTEDPETHEKLDKENIRFQMGTFLVAGHETTSGTLSFLFHNLLSFPETYHKAQQEVDEVVGDDTLTVKHIPKLVYLDACIKETLRYMGPISLMRRHCKKPIRLAGKYELTPDMTIIASMRGLHHDPAVWGDDHDKFKPERMIPFDKVPKDAWRPFGAGMRACIGRTFAEQEMLINVALILQRFQVELADPGYVMRLKSTLTVKPDGLYLKVRRRPGKSDMVGLPGGQVGQGEQKKKNTEMQNGHATEKKPLTVLYGTNAGTCKAYADEITASATGFEVTVQTLDSATEHVPDDQPVVIICPSYEGKPADNAKKFVSWLEHNKGKSDLLKGVKYTVFGVGNSEWASTFHKVPKLIDDQFSKLGATKIMESGFVDVKSDMMGPWEEFLDSLLQTLGQEESTEEVVTKVSASESSISLGGSKLIYGTVEDNVETADASVGPPKKHITIRLPKGQTYQTGDYLSILPYNHTDIVKRVERRFGISADDRVEITGTNKAYLKSDTPIPIIELLAMRLELNTPITQKQLSKLATLTEDSKEKKSIEHMAEDDIYAKEVLPKRFSVLDVLEDHPSCTISFGGYLDMLKAMSMRQYSIASSPMSPANFGSDTLTASLSYDVQTGGELAHPERSFHGVASSFLSRLTKGDRIHCLVTSTNAAFHLPKDPTVPVIMIAAGTGLSPMRGFIEERAALVQARKVGPALLYYGCRDFEKDYIHRRELEEWESQGAVQLRPVFSKRSPDGQKWKYVPDRMWDERDEIAELFKGGAKIFVCGSASKLAKTTAEMCKKIYQEKTGTSDEEADKWLEQVREDRYVSDVFG